MGLYDKWKKETEEKINKFTKDEKLKDEVPSIIKRCPKCFELSLEFDAKKSKIRCKKCGFETDIKTLK